jgi:hypothetical protein
MIIVPTLNAQVDNNMNIFDDDEHAELNDLQYKAVVYYTAKVCRYQWYKLVWLFESV